MGTPYRAKMNRKEIGMNRAGLYERDSTDAQAERYGLGAQDWALKKRAQERGYTIVPDYRGDGFVDDGYSGGDLDRPALSRLRQAIREGHLDVILCYDPDRLSRSLADLLLLTDEFERAGVRLEFITQDTDASPEGKMFFAIRGAVAEYERAKTRERTTRGRIQKAKQGKVINPRCLPTWLRYDRQTEAVYVDEEWAKVARLAFRLVADEGLKLSDLRKRFNSLNIPTPLGGTYWQLTTLDGWLRNPAAKGEYYQLRYQKVEPQRRRKPIGKRRKTGSRERDRSQWETVRVPSIVSLDLWEEVQRRLDQNKALASRNCHREYLVRGLAHCGHCGAHMSAWFDGSLRRYRCNHSYRTDIHGNKCPFKPVRADDVERAVWQELSRLLQEPDTLRKELRRRREKGSPTRETAERELLLTRRRLEAIPQEQDRLVEGYGKGLIPDDLMRSRMDVLKTEKEDLERRAGELERQLTALEMTEEQEAQALAFAEKVRSGLGSLDFAEKQELFRLLVEDVTCYDDKAVIHTIIPVPPPSPPSEEKLQLYTSPR